jgi:hypothetical protein
VAQVCATESCLQVGTWLLASYVRHCWDSGERWSHRARCFCSDAFHHHHADYSAGVGVGVDASVGVDVVDADVVASIDFAASVVAAASIVGAVSVADAASVAVAANVPCPYVSFLAYAVMGAATEHRQ